MKTQPYLPELRIGRAQLAEHAAFWRYCAQSELRFQRCATCGAYRHPPGPLCPHCRSPQCRWELAPDDAMLFSYTVVHHAATRALADAVPYNVAIVAFPSIGNLRIVSNVIDAAAAELHIGMPLVLAWQPLDKDRQLPRFRKRPARTVAA